MFCLISHIFTTIIICMVALQVVMFGSFFLHEYRQIFQKECPGFMQECNFFEGNGDGFSRLTYLFRCHPSNTADCSNYWALRKISPIQAKHCNLSDALVSFSTYILVILTSFSFFLWFLLKYICRIFAGFCLPGIYGLSSCFLNKLLLGVAYGILPSFS